MEIRNNTNNLAFQARLSPQLKSTLKTYASQKGEKTQKMLRDKMSQVATWGRKDSEIVSAIDIDGSSDTIKESLALFNHSISKQSGGSLPQLKKDGDVKSLFKNLMNLTEADIVKAEDEIANTVNENKVELLLKAFKNSELMQKITGKFNSQPEDAWQNLGKMSEEKITALRFGLDSKTSDFMPTLEKDGFEWIV